MATTKQQKAEVVGYSSSEALQRAQASNDPRLTSSNQTVLTREPARVKSSSSGSSRTAEQKAIEKSLRKDLAHGKITDAEYRERSGLAPAEVEAEKEAAQSMAEPIVSGVVPKVTPGSVEAQRAVTQGNVASVDQYEQAVRSGQDLAARMRQGLSLVQGTPAPQTQGGAQTAIQQAVPQGTNQSFVDNELALNDDWNQLMKDVKEYYSPENQKSSLKDYTKMYARSGLDELDEEIIDAQTVIEGTEDDIRNEIQAAGGFGTDSQIQALASARNKVLLKNYNRLVALRQVKQQNFDTMFQLSQQDRQMADQRFQQSIQMRMQDIQYKQTFIKNTRDQMNTLFTANPMGFYEAYSKDSRQRGFAEQILGLPQGGLLGYAQGLQQDIDLDRKYKQAQINKIYSEQLPTEDIYSPMNIESLEDIAKAPVSTLTKSVMAGYSKLKDLTPTDRSIVAQELYKVGFNPQQYVLRKLDSLSKKWDSVPDEFKGIIAGRFQPFASSRNAQVAEFEAQRQLLTREISRLNDVGVLSDQDVLAYKSAMPSRGDSSIDVVNSKIKGIRDAIGTSSPQVKGTSVIPGSTIRYNGKDYNVDANGNMTPA